MRNIMRVLIISVFMFSLCINAISQPIVRAAVLRAKDQPVVYVHETDDLRKRIIETQSFLASEMKRHGFDAKTFGFSQNIPIYIGAKNLSEYEKDADVVRWQQGLALKEFPADIHLIFLAGAGSINDGFSGIFTHKCDNSGNCDFRRLVIIPLAGNVEYRNRVIIHELIHAFGFYEHLTTGKNYVMEKALPIIEGEGHLLNFKIHPDVAKTLNSSDDLSIIEGVDTSQFDGRFASEDNKSDNDDKDDASETEIAADVNDDGYVDLYDVLIVRSGMNAEVSYDTDVNNDGRTDEIDLLIVKAIAIEAIVKAAPSKRKVKITTWGAMKR